MLHWQSEAEKQHILSQFVISLVIIPLHLSPRVNILLLTLTGYNKTWHFLNKQDRIWDSLT